MKIFLAGERKSEKKLMCAVFDGVLSETVIIP
jgi:hypothetical protein